MSQAADSRLGGTWRMSQKRTSPGKELFNPLRRQKGTVKRCCCATFSGEFVRAVFPISAKADFWQFQI